MKKPTIDLTRPHRPDRHLQQIRKKKLVYSYKGRQYTKHIEERREDFELARISRDGGRIISCEFVDGENINA